MSRPWRTQPSRALLISPLAAVLLITLAAGTAAAAASVPLVACQSWTSIPPPSPGTSDNELGGVTALSPCNVWAVGGYRNMGSTQGLSLAEHWNGTTWKVVPTPSPGSQVNFLVAVSAVSATNIWAVGNTSDGPADTTFILHWNGRTWNQVPSPSPGSDFNGLSGSPRSRLPAPGQWVCTPPAASRRP